jgi:multisubunit Na+/H+ antiporter MnhB subunit
VRRRRLLSALEFLMLLLTALFIFGALRGDHPESSEMGRHIVTSGSHETGVLNLVTAIYLGYRAFDTMGETIVLLVAVSGVLYFLMTGNEEK